MSEWDGAILFKLHYIRSNIRRISLHRPQHQCQILHIRILIWQQWWFRGQIFILFVVVGRGNIPISWTIQNIPRYWYRVCMHFPVWRNIPPPLFTLWFTHMFYWQYTRSNVTSTRDVICWPKIPLSRPGDGELYKYSTLGYINCIMRIVIYFQEPGCEYTI